MHFLFIFSILNIGLYRIQSNPLDTSIQNFTQCGTLKCLNHALCTSDGKRKACQCRRGFKGEICKDDVNECKIGSPCFHRGYCNNTFGSWRCDCLSGWANNDEKQQHCLNKTNLNFRKCISGWMGEMCQDQCLNSSICGQNQVCKKYGRGLRCLCEDGWEGDNCDEDVDECAAQPCNATLVCTNVPGSYSCEVPPTPEKADSGGLNTTVIIVASLGALLLLILSIFILITAKIKCKKNLKRRKERTAVLPEKSNIS